MENLIFISNTSILHPRGGWDGLGGKIYALLREHFPSTRLVEKLNPEISLFPKVVSKILRSAGLRGNFPVFNEKRLKEIAGIVQANITKEIDYIFFHGATPWIGYQPDRPYAAFLDCSFMTYMNYYHDIGKFNKKDIARIMLAERKFFENAHKVFFSSQWAISDTRRLYNIDGSNFVRIGQGPTTNTKPLETLAPVVKKQFLFIGLDFLGKGGAEVCESFQRVVKDHPDYELIIAGQKPPDKFISEKNVRYVGFLNKSNPEGLAQLEQLFRESRALVMMTRKDIAPVAVIEAGLLGCISIANRITALSEMVRDRETGFLINNNTEELYLAMKEVASMPDQTLLQMRTNAKTFFSTEYSWNRVIEIMQAHMQQTTI